ncbi:MAG: acetoin utilization deacetylase AcuC-like enzyme [Bradymonadia bacterium]|jgi:acetoin utilization deacetylase AcuC-like enzyme
MKLPCYFHPDQLQFKPAYEWAFGNKIRHPETTARAENILRALKKNSVFDVQAPKSVPLGAIKRSHSYQLVTLYNAASRMPEGETFYPSVFPRGSLGRGDPTNIRHAGAFCFDSGTPLCNQTWTAASWSAACGYSAASAVLHGEPIAYALSRPPGHHATKELFGGYSYFNNTAIAAKRLRAKGTVAVLDIDFHHGNGTQAIFERDANVLTVSVHGDPREFYPFFSGYAGEQGVGRGAGFNLNLPLPGGTDGDRFLEELDSHALPAVANFAPDYLVVAAGFDTYERDPVGDFRLTTADYRRVGEAIGKLKLPTVVVQEGGYYAPHLGRNVVSFLGGLAG